MVSETPPNTSAHTNNGIFRMSSLSKRCHCFSSPGGRAMRLWQNANHTLRHAGDKRMTKCSTVSLLSRHSQTKYVLRHLREIRWRTVWLKLTPTLSSYRKMGTKFIFIAFTSYTALKILRLIIRYTDVVSSSEKNLSFWLLSGAQFDY